MKSFLIILTFLFIGFYSLGQATQVDSIRFAGTVYDADSLEVLPHALLFYRNHRITSDKDGYFQLLVGKGDFLRFSHVGYKDAQVIVSDSLMDKEYLFGVFLKKDTIALPEVIVVSRHDRLAVEARYMPVVISPSQLNAVQNVRKSTHVALTTAPVKMDAQMNQSMQQSEHVTDITYRGMISPDKILGLGLNQLNTISKNLSDRDKERRRTDRAPMTQAEIDYMLYLYRLTVNKTKF